MNNYSVVLQETQTDRVKQGETAYIFAVPDIRAAANLIGKNAVYCKILRGHEWNWLISEYAVHREFANQQTGLLEGFPADYFEYTNTFMRGRIYLKNTQYKDTIEAMLNLLAKNTSEINHQNGRSNRTANGQIKWAWNLAQFVYFAPNYKLDKNFRKSE